MKLTILGNNSALPAQGRNPSAQLLEIDSYHFLIDCGEGTQMQMNKYNIKKNKISHIFISHLHGDHYFGLIGLINSYGLLGRKENLYIYGPEQLLNILNIQLEACNSMLPYQIIFEAIEDVGTVKTLLDTEKVSVTCFPVEHKIPTHGFLFTEKNSGRKIQPEACRKYEVPQAFYNQLKAGEDYQRKDGMLVKNEWVTSAAKPEKRYAYCADTRYTLSFLSHIRNADWIYHESTYLEAEETLAAARYHTTAKQAARLAKEAETAQLLLGHYSTRYKEIEAFEAEAKTIFEHCIATAEGMTFEI